VARWATPSLTRCSAGIGLHARRLGREDFSLE
jgi:hypothetical protein